VLANGNLKIVGNLSEVNGVNYVWPVSQSAGSDYVLTNNGSGALRWAPAPGGGTGSVLQLYLENTSAISFGPQATGNDSVAIGDGATAQGLNSYAIGGQSSLFSSSGPQALGDNSLAMGTGTVAYSFGESVFGINNTVENPNNTSNYDSGDRLFVVGNGQDSADLADAFTILKNGNAALGVSNWETDGDSGNTMLKVNGNVKIVGDLTAINNVDYSWPNSQAAGSGYVLTNNGTGILSWAASSSGWSLTGNTGTDETVNFIGTTDAHDFVIKVNNTEAGRFYVNGNIALGGGSAPTAGTSTSLGMFVVGSGAGSTTSGLHNSNFIGSGAGQSASGAFSSNFFGNGAGTGATSAYGSNFIGEFAGGLATNANNSNFFGLNAAVFADHADNSNFFGGGAGFGATTARFSNFFGYASGQAAINANNSNFFGQQSGNGATNSSQSFFVGQNAGRYLSASNIGSPNAANSIFIGSNAGYNTGDFTLDNVTTPGWSILLGNDTSTGGYSDSIALGAGATNTATNQLMIGSTSSPINTTRFQGSSAGTQCTITTGTGIACTSDERLKTNIIDLSTTTLDNLLKVRTVNYNLIGDSTNRNQVGFLAQDLEQVFPDLVDTDSNGYKSVYYAQMTPILTEAIRELNMKVTPMMDLTTSNNSFVAQLVVWLGSATNGITDLFAKTMHADSVKTNQLCVGTTCVDEAQLQQLLLNQSHTPTPMTTGGTTSGSTTTTSTAGDSTSTTGTTSGGATTTTGDVTAGGTGATTSTSRTGDSTTASTGGTTTSDGSTTGTDGTTGSSTTGTTTTSGATDAGTPAN
jgi:hypothetical protein